MRKGLLPSLTVAICAAALLPAAPALAADPVLTVTVARDGGTLSYERYPTTSVAWPVPVTGSPDPSVTRFDLDGDGRDDLVSGFTLLPVAGSTTARSAVLIRYASGENERIIKAGSGLGTRMSVADFNGDGFGDLAIADTAGLWIFPGSATGLDPDAAVLLNASSAGMPAGLGPLTGPQAVADFNGDGRADIAIGQSAQTVGTQAGAGAVLVLSGRSDLFLGQSSTRIDEETSGLPGAATAGAQFGSAVAAGDVTGDGRPDLVVGARGQDVAGSIYVLPGSADGVSPQSTSMVDGSALDDVALHVHWLGTDLTVAEVTGDGRADVVATAPESTVAGRMYAGATVVLPGTAAGITAAGRRIWQRNTAGVPGDAAAFDQFGATVAAGDVTGDGRPEVLVSRGSTAGGVTVLANSDQGLTGPGSVDIASGASIQIQTIELSGDGGREVVLGSTTKDTIYRVTGGTESQLGTITAATMGAADLTAQVSFIGALPHGLPASIPVAGPVRTPVTPPLAHPRSRFDFDGDGKDDVVVGNEDGAIVRYSGLGRADELDPYAAPTAIWPSFAAGDFNGDGYADLAMGDFTENRDSPSLRQPGGVWITYGGPAGLDYDHGVLITQDTPGVPGASESNDRFGASLAAGDLNGDGRADLAIGAPGEGVNSASTAAGAVTVLYGSPTGLTATGSEWLAQSAAWIPGAEESNDQFGNAVAIGDVTGDGRADLAIASVGENSIGSVDLIKGGATALVETGVASIVYSDFKLSTAGGVGFGTSLAVADLNKDGKAEVIAGAPDASAGKVQQAGVVISLTGSATGIVKTAFRVLDQDSTGVAGGSESGDEFGSSLATGDVTGDGYNDVLVGVPGEAIGTVRQAGMVNLLTGSSAGLSGTGGIAFDQNSTNVPDTAETDDEFGSSVAILNSDGAGGQDALVGGWGENVVSTDQNHSEGLVTQFVASGKTLAPTGVWDQYTLESSTDTTFGESEDLGISALAS